MEIEDLWLAVKTEDVSGGGDGWPYKDTREYEGPFHSELAAQEMCDIKNEECKRNKHYWTRWAVRKVKGFGWYW